MFARYYQVTRTRKDREDALDAVLLVFPIHARPPESRLCGVRLARGGLGDDSPSRRSRRQSRKTEGGSAVMTGHNQTTGHPETIPIGELHTRVASAATRCWTPSVAASRGSMDGSRGAVVRSQRLRTARHLRGAAVPDPTPGSRGSWVTSSSRSTRPSWCTPPRPAGLTATSWGRVTAFGVGEGGHRRLLRPRTTLQHRAFVLAESDLVTTRASQHDT
jgi:hypothetical protein